MTEHGEPHRLASPEALDPAAIEGFRRRGFVAFDRFTDLGEIDELRAAYDDIIDGRSRAMGDRRLGDVIRQVMVPSTVAPVFATCDAVEVGHSVARRVFDDDDVERTYEMLIDKPPGALHETPWHQDIGYFGRPVAPAGTAGDVPSIQFWLALDDVDVDNGCMEFTPTEYGAESLEHVVVSGDPDEENRLIALADDDGVDRAAITPCPLPAGGCTAHFVTTPHRTGPNVTVDRRRRAFIFNIGPAAMARRRQAAVAELWSTDDDSSALEIPD